MKLSKKKSSRKLKMSSIPFRYERLKRLNSRLGLSDRTLLLESYKVARKENITKGKRIWTI